jgi:protein SCO1/2
MHLVDQDGELLREDDLSDGILVMNFMFTSCPSACPQLTRRLRRVFDLLPDETRTHVQFLSVSVDPEHDRPETLKDFARRHRADLPRWRFARVESAELLGLSERLTVFEPGAASTPSAHSMAIYVFDQKGHPLQRYDGTTIDPGHLAREITALAGFEASSKS